MIAHKLSEVLITMRKDQHSRAPEEEYDKGVKDDWKKDMQDGEEIDDIEEKSLDDELQHPRTRQRYSC
jgi:hypothetical protein